MANTHVQSVKGEWSSGASWTVAITATTGNLLSIAVGLNANGTLNDITGISDGTNTYTQIDTLSQSELGDLNRLTTYYVKNVTGGSLTITITTTNSSTNRGFVIVHEISGADTTAPLDVSAIQRQVLPGLGSDDISSGAVVTAANGEYVFGSSMVTNGNVTFTAGTGFTADQATSWSASEHLIQSSAGSIAATFSETFGDLKTNYTAVATFKAATSYDPGAQVSLGSYDQQIFRRSWR